MDKSLYTEACEMEARLEWVAYEIFGKNKIEDVPDGANTTRFKQWVKFVRAVQAASIVQPKWVVVQCEELDSHIGDSHTIVAVHGVYASEDEALDKAKEMSARHQADPAPAKGEMVWSVMGVTERG